MVDRLSSSAVLDFRPQTEVDPFERFARLDFYKKENARLLNSLNLQKGDVVLDLACGPGNLSVGIAEAVGSEGTIVAVDMSKVALAAAAKNLEGVDATVHYIQAEGGTIGNVLEPLAGKFDAIVCGNALHNFPDKEATFAGIYKLLKEGGAFAMNSTFWDGAIPESEDLFYKKWLRGATERAIAFSKENDIEIKGKEKVEARKQYTPDEWRQFFTNAGFSIYGFSNSEVEMPRSGFTAISQDVEFVDGALHRFRQDVASQALKESAREVFAQTGKRFSLRNWLAIWAVKR